ncbi:XRE family transcriptional regulator [Corynebacterium sp. sy017]|nr:XRE family transcriptional regulator [Corynebacterium sp. sy017]TSD91419.1 XRE family transcriptional regulator [Corynebacterium sp. SY003]
MYPLIDTFQTNGLAYSSMDAQGDAEFFGRRLRHARMDRGLSQRALALGICSPSAVSRWESGESSPSGEMILRLAARLGIDAHVLSGQGFDSRLAQSDASFDELLHISWDSYAPDSYVQGAQRWCSADDSAGCPGASGSSPLNEWMSHAKYIGYHADPWRAASLANPTSLVNLRNLVDDLAVHPLTVSYPVAAQTVEILDAVVRLKDNPGAEATEVVVETLSGTQHAPAALRRTALEIVVGTYLLAGMPVAAHAALRRAKVVEISLATQVMLCWDGCDGDSAVQEHNQDSHVRGERTDTSVPTLLVGAEPVNISSERSARDVAFHILYDLRNSGFSTQKILESLSTACGNDRLIMRWGEEYCS